MRIPDVCSIVLLTALLATGGCSRKKSAPLAVKDFFEACAILDFQASDEWKATHTITATWRGKQYALPMVVTSTRQGKIGFDFFRSDSDEMHFTLYDDPVTLNVEPAAELDLTLLKTGLILPQGAKASGTSATVSASGKLKYLQYYCLAPEEAAAGVKYRSDEEMEKLLQSPAIKLN